MSKISCGDFEVLWVAADLSNLPSLVKQRMQEHQKTCVYHDSAGFRAAMIDTPITQTLEDAARKIIINIAEE